MNRFFRIILTLILLLTPFLCYSENNKKIIYVYNDEGAGETSLKQTIDNFKKVTSRKYQVKTINSVALLKKQWMFNAALLIIPGGADIPYTKKLNGKGNELIKEYVKEGGSFLGICAGGYYGSGYVEFDKGGSLEVLRDRELGFFPGKAIGPFLAKYDYVTNSGVRAALVNTTIGIDSLYLYFNGGGYFEDASSYPNVSVIGKYIINKNETKPAIIYIKYGKGNVILSGVHFEYDPYTLNSKDQHIKKLLPDLKDSNYLRLDLISKLLQKLGL